MAARADNIAESKEPVAPAAARPLSNYTAIQRLTLKFASYIELQNLKVPGVLLRHLCGDDPAAKLAFIKAHLAPRAATLEQLVAEQAGTNEVKMNDDQIDRCCAYLRAMIEIAEA